MRERARREQMVMGLALGLGICLTPGCGSGTVHDGPADAAAPDAALPTADATVPDAAPPGPDGSPDPDACVPATCQPGQCRTLEDGCGGTLDCGGCPALGETCGGAGVPNTCGPLHPILHAEPGCFLDVVDVNASWEVQIGDGTTYRWMAVEYEAVHGGWREELFSRDVLNHNLFGLTRNVSAFVGRYILGNGAQIMATAPNLRPRSVFYGRVDLEEKPAGLGYTGYTSWRRDYVWVEGETYRFRIELDAVAQTQTLRVFHGGQLEFTTVGDIPYFDPSLTAVTWTATFGGDESDGRDVKPVGWQFCNLLIQAEPL